MATLVILESPGKKGKVAKYLGTGYTVEASVGHVRQLADTGEDSTGIAFEGDLVHCNYAPVSGAKRRIDALKSKAEKADRVILATDPDREGEAIAWHLAQELGLRQVKRARFSEITEAAVQKAVANPQPLDTNLAEAARARDALDKLVGYKLSPLLWKLGNGAKSAGRCQSAALHLLCDRERQIEQFQPKTFWTVAADLGGFGAEYEDDEGNRRIFDRDRARAIARAVEQSKPVVANVDKQTQRRNPPPALTTSTLQQEAGKRLGFGTDKTMKLAQKLYEAGAITYHRTDSVELSPEFCAEVRDWLQTNAPDAVPEQTSNRSGAQAAHEAIRPTEVDRTEVDVSADADRLYELIRARAIASQCAKAVLERVRVEVQAGETRLTATGQTLVSPGYTQFWNNLKQDNPLPALQQGQALDLNKVLCQRDKTKPPSRLKEPELVKRLETDGIGRPSTFASIVKTLLSRKYVERSRGYLVPTQLGREVDDFLSRVTPELLKPSFTAAMESSLDAIAEGKKQWERYITSWYRKKFLPSLEQGEQIAAEEFGRAADEQTEHTCQFCGAEGLTKRYSNSPKLETDHYLVCPECESPHFWRDGDYQLPYRLRRRADASQKELSKHDCPECGAKLEVHRYERDGQQREMLRCSELRKDRCDRVAFFPSPAGWRSKHYPTLTEGALDFSDLVSDLV